MYTELRDLMIYASKKAGSVLLKYFSRRDLGIIQKSINADLVTNADKEAQDILLDIFSREYPNIPIVAEEKENIKQETAFFIDPLDGTLNFVHGFPFFAVSIGYWENGSPKIGVVYNPVSDELFWAIEKKGAYLGNVRLSVSPVSSIEESLIVTGWPYDRSSINMVIRNVKDVLSKAQEIRSLGSAALECSYVAKGVFDGYWEWGLASWDLAAGVLIAKESGAKVSGKGGEDFSLEKGNIVVSTPSIHKDLLLLLSLGEQHEI